MHVKKFNHNSHELRFTLIFMRRLVSLEPYGLFPESDLAFSCDEDRFSHLFPQILQLRIFYY